MTREETIRVTRRLLRPYVIPDDCPYLSEDQRELSKLTIEGRSAWMAERLALAAGVRHAEGAGTRCKSPEQKAPDQALDRQLRPGEP